MNMVDVARTKEKVGGMGGQAYICLRKMLGETILRGRAAYWLERWRGVWCLGLDKIAWDRIPLRSERFYMNLYGKGFTHRMASVFSLGLLDCLVIYMMHIPAYCGRVGVLDVVYAAMMCF